MTKAQNSTTVTTVQDSKSGRSVTVRGVGALKGHLTIRKGVDLTKPIAAQTSDASKKSNGAIGQAKH
jgi:hypothetical protein